MDRLIMVVMIKGIVRWEGTGKLWSFCENTCWCLYIYLKSWYGEWCIPVSLTPTVQGKMESHTVDNTADKINQIPLPILNFRSSSDSIYVINESPFYFYMYSRCWFCVCHENCDLIA